MNSISWSPELQAAKYFRNTMSGKPSLTNRFCPPRFSLRTVLVLMLGVSIAFGMGVRWRYNVRKQGDSFRWLLARANHPAMVGDGQCTLEFFPDDQISFATSTVRMWVDPDYGRRLKDIYFRRETADANFSAHIKNCFEVDRVRVGKLNSQQSLLNIFSAKGLKDLALHDRLPKPEKPVDWTHVQRANQLELLHITSAIDLPPEFVMELRRLPSLTKLSLPTDAIESLRELTQLPHLQRCTIRGEKPLDEALYGHAAATYFEPTKKEAMRYAFASLAEHKQLFEVALLLTVPVTRLSRGTVRPT